MYCPQCGSSLSIRSDNESRTIYKCLFETLFFEHTQGNLRWLGEQWPVTRVPPATEADGPALPAEAFVPLSRLEV